MSFNVVPENTVIEVTNEKQLSFLLLIGEIYNLKNNIEVIDEQFEEYKKDIILSKFESNKPVYIDFNWTFGIDYSTYLDASETLLTFNLFLSHIKIKKNKITRKGLSVSELDAFRYINVDKDNDYIDFLISILDANNFSFQGNHDNDLLVVYDIKEYTFEDNFLGEEVISPKKFIKKFTKIVF